MKVLPVKTLIKNALLALVFPFKAFKSIPDNTSVHYKSVIILLSLTGLVWAIAHSLVLEGAFIFYVPLKGLVQILITPLFSIGIWLSAVVLFHKISKIFAKDVTIEKLEIASFYLWFIWALMPLFDLPHLLFGLKIVSIFGAGAHTSWIFAFFFFPILSFFLLRDLLRFSTKQVVTAILISASVPFAGRFIVENLPIVLNKILSIYHIPIGYTLSALFVGPVMLIYIYNYWKKIKINLASEKYFLNSTVLTFIYCISMFYLVFGTPLLKIIPPGKTIESFRLISGDFGNGKSFYTHSYTWVSADYEAGTILHPPAGVGNDDSSTYWSDTYTDVVDLDFIPSFATVSEIRVKVHFTAATVNNQGGAGPKAQGCLINFSATTYCSPWTNNLNGASDQTFTMNANSFYTYDASGDGAKEHSSVWSSFTSVLAALNNDLIVHTFTNGDGDATAETGDKIAYDSAIVEIDYTTHLTQKTYRWYANADSVTPGAALAAQNTAVSGIDRTNIVRLRMSVDLQTGFMAASTEAFKLQYAKQSGGVCSGAGPVWEDVGGSDGSGGAWKGYNNPTPADGTTIASSLLDSLTNKLQSYEEANNSVNNPTAITTAPLTGEWDWAIINNGADPSANYCFRMVQSNGLAFATYTNYPVIGTSVLAARSIKGKVNFKGKVNIR